MKFEDALNEGIIQSMADILPSSKKKKGKLKKKHVADTGLTGWDGCAYSFKQLADFGQVTHKQDGRSKM